MNNLSSFKLGTLRLAATFQSSLPTIAKRLAQLVTIASMLTLSALAQTETDADFDVAQPPTVERSVNENGETEQPTAAPAAVQSRESAAATTASSSDKADDGRFFGTTKITEHKRENGQVYSIELEHSSGSKQYIEDTDADGLSDSRTKDIDSHPNIAKWRIGSW